ncbi:unnamed protein product [Ambrosiozyma monospora]|uniref:Unnamed protein product n=1 Tax=Ambrosiozyma monospora TaxID=43982 RepID=A0ACB5SW18_AMBMO|nr:unnamed protein product [Ambrosiozyma monospora]
MLSQEYPSVPMSVSDDLCIKENYLANEASDSRRTRTTHKRLSIHRLFEGVFKDDCIFETGDEHDEADQQDDSSSSSSGDKKSFMQRILEVKDEMPADQNDVHVNIVRRNDLQTCQAAPQGYMDAHEFLKTKKPKSRLVNANDIRLVGNQGSHSDSESDYVCTVLPVKRSYYCYATLLETIPLPQPESFYDAWLSHYYSDS